MEEKPQYLSDHGYADQQTKRRNSKGNDTEYDRE